MVAARMSVPDRAMRKQVWGPIDDGDQVFLGGGGRPVSEGRQLWQGFVFCLLKIEGIRSIPFALATNRVPHPHEGAKKPQDITD